MKSRLFKKFFFTTAIIVTVCLTVTLTILSFVISNYFSREKYELLSSNCQSVSEIALFDINSSNFKRNIFNIISVQNKVSQVDTFITDTQGKIIACGCEEAFSGEVCYHSKQIIPNIILEKACMNKFSESGTLGGIYNEIYYSVGMPIKSADNHAYGYVFSSTSAQSLREILSAIYRMYFLSASIPLILMFVAVYTMSYRFTKPLKLMSEAAKSMARGDFSKRIPIYSDDEIGELSVSFNDMTNSLERLEKMRRSFVANVSHELRTPMTTIAGFIDGIADGTISEEKSGYYLNIVSSEVKRLSRIVESMLNLSRLEAGEVNLNPSLFSVSDTLVNVVISREQHITEKNITIKGLDELEQVNIYADFDLIYQVIYNLVDNAVKFTNQSGTISFKLSEKGGMAQFEIKNTGYGILKENLNSIFERFYKIDKSRSANKNSTGLGLYIVKTIIKIHHGKIVAESVENEYTLFRVILPVRNNNIGGKK